jgi:hypothetical protein
MEGERRKGDDGANVDIADLSKDQDIDGVVNRHEGSDGGRDNRRR